MEKIQIALQPFMDTIGKEILSEKGIWLAGGALRRAYTDLPLNTDFDFFFQSEEKYQQIYAKLVSTNGVNSNVYRSVSNFYYLGYKIQLIHIEYFANKEALINSFPFTMQQFVMNYKGNIISGPYTAMDCQDKVLRINSEKITNINPISEMRAMLKYRKEGYSLSTNFLREWVARLPEDMMISPIPTQYP